MRLLIFAGAGTSVELGVPAMEGMAIEFLRYSEEWNVEPALVRRMMRKNLDLEPFIERLDQICAARDPLEDFQDLEVPLDRFNTVRSEVEWFVQHTAERISARDAHLMWGSVLRKAKEHELTLVTTNYDRAIELAANAQGMSLADGFESFSEKEVAAWVGISVGSKGPWIVKLHGSTDWYADKVSGNPLKLRHPMPLFGRGTLRLSSGEELGSSLALPSREKILNQAPYPRLSQAFLNAVDRCEAAVFVGSSLRDPNVRDAALTISRDRDVFVVNPGGDSLGVHRAHAIAQPASRFLISTLTAALSRADPLRMLVEASGVSEKRKGSILGLLRVATDGQEPTERRCEAIEELDEQSVTLDEYLIRELLSDGDGTVSRYALGLVPICRAGSALVSEAVESPHAADPAFAEELRLLREMIADEK